MVKPEAFGRERLVIKPLRLPRHNIDRRSTNLVQESQTDRMSAPLETWSGLGLCQMITPYFGQPSDKILPMAIGYIGLKQEAAENPGRFRTRASIGHPRRTRAELSLIRLDPLDARTDAIFQGTPW